MNSSADSAVVDCGVYVDGCRLPRAFTPAEAMTEVSTRGDGFVWVGLHEPDTEVMRQMAAIFDLHPLAVEDAVHAHQRPKLERYDDTLFLVLKTVQFIPHESLAVAREIVETGEIMVFANSRFVVTVRHGDFSGLTGLRRELQADPEQARMGPFAVLHAIADHVVDHYLDVTLLVEGDVDALEEQVFATRNNTDIEHIYLLKREIVEFRRAVSPLSVALQRIVSDHKDLMSSKEIRRHIGNVIDHQALASERIASADDILTSLVNAASARVGVQQSTDLRKISAFVAIAAVPTAIAGIYGMNFDHMLELRQQWGYPVVLTLIVSVCTLLFVVFRRNGWL